MGHRFSVLGNGSGSRWVTAAAKIGTSALIAFLALSACSDRGKPIQDEALASGVQASRFVQADEDYFRDMDGGVALTPAEVRGRNMWNVWSGGNDRFWDYMTHPTYGAFDLLKIVTSHPSQEYGRKNRWAELGLVNEPCFRAPVGPDPAHFGLWLDIRDPSCPPDPFANAEKYPGVKIGARGEDIGGGKVLPVGSYYGEPTGILGLRLFPNPNFDAKAAAQWDPERYYTDPSYYNRRDLVRPYRVGMSCGFCHIGPSPTNPPADPENPTFANLSSTVGAQYMWVDRLFIPDRRKTNFMYQLVSTYRPGAMDTSLVSTDNINNPRTMNTLYHFGERLRMAKLYGRETLAGGELNNKQFNDFVQDGPLTEFFEKPATTYTPHILKDGSDSVGALGALNRVYLNIGLFSEEWLTHFNAVVGGKEITTIPIATAQKNSAYWQATEVGTPDTALFFLKATGPHNLADAPGGQAYLAASATQVSRGAEVFAETCARCHSSKQPALPAPVNLGQCNGPDYMQCFKRWWQWTQTPDFKAEMRAVVAQPDFRENNYLSTDIRVPITLLRTNACSPLATNALGNNIWNDFSSQSYKSLPSVGTISVADPFTGEKKPYAMPAGGRGYTRVPTLVSLWSTAPFLLNNSVGPFVIDPSVAGRMRSFDASIEQMLWPERRQMDPVLGSKVDGQIDRTTLRSQITIPSGYVPQSLRKLVGAGNKVVPQLVDENGDIIVGPIPSGVPVNLLANLRPLSESDDPGDKAAHVSNVASLLLRLKLDLLRLPANADDATVRATFANLVGPMMRLNKCPDFVVNRGHYFGTAKFNETDGLSEDERSWGTEPVLSDAEKRALIAFLKTL
jgi:hypothetical protein